MTNPTPPGQVPDALIYAELPEHAATGLGQEYESFDQNGKPMGKAHQNLVYYTGGQMRAFADATHALRAQQDDAYDHGPQAETVEEAARDVGKWLNERPNRPLDLRHVAMLTHHAKRTAHVQNPAEIEHVAGDVSKNGAESNMAQPPAPSEQQPFGWIKQSEIDMANNFGGSINLWRQQYNCDVPVYLAQQPAPSAAAAGIEATIGSIMGAAYDFRDAHLCGSMNEKRSAHAALDSAVRQALAPHPSPTAQAAPALAENGHLTQAGHDLLMEASLAGATLVSKGRLVGDTAQATESVTAPAGGAAILKEILAAACCEDSETYLTNDQYRKLYDLQRRIESMPTQPTHAADSVTAPAGAMVDEWFLRSVIMLCNNQGASPESIENFDSGDKWIADLWRQAERALPTAPQPSPTAQAASSTVLKAIREANMQLVRTGDNAFMLVPYKVATAQAAGSVPAGDVAEPEWKSEDFEVTHYPPMPTTGFRVGMPKGVKVLHKPTGLFATSEEERSQHRNRDVAWNKLQEVLAARAPAESVGRDAERLDFLIEQRAYVVSDPDTCPGYWLNFIHKETGKRWVQCDEHPTPRAAIDAAMAANGGNK